MRHLVIMDILPQGELACVGLGVLDTAMGPHPQALDGVVLGRKDADTLERLLRRVRPERDGEGT